MRRVAADERRCKRAHNLEVVGSNPAPATKNLQESRLCRRVGSSLPQTGDPFADFIFGMTVTGAAAIGVGMKRGNRR